MSSSRRHFGRWVIGSLLAATLLGVAVWLSLRPDPGPLIEIHFEGLHTTGNPAYPYGKFMIRNRSGRRLVWDAEVEVVGDPGFALQQAFSSARAGGAFAGAAEDRFQLLVTARPRASFRLVVDAQQRRALPVRAWLWASDRLPLLHRIWQPSRLRHRLVPGDWCVAAPATGPGAPPATSPR